MSGTEAGYSFDGPTYTFLVERLACEMDNGRPDGACSRPAAHQVINQRDGRRILLCEQDLQPWLDQRRWAVLRMAYPYASQAEVEQLFPRVVEVNYRD